jgi:GNAT superfamily N-acetyltransferase
MPGQAVRLHSGDTLRLIRALESEPIQNVTLLAELEAHGVDGGEWWGWHPELLGVCRIDGTLRLHARAEAAVDAFVPVALRHAGRCHAMVGARSPVSRLWRRLQSAGWRAHGIRRNAVYRVQRDELLPGPGAPLRPARSDELEEVLEHAAAMYREDIGSDPLVDGPTAFRRRIVSRVERQQSYVWKEGGKFVFKADVGSRTRHTVQIEGVWTPPSHRRRGYATRGLGELCRRLLGDVPAVCLYVNEANTAARRLYEGLGFRHHQDSLAVWL